MEAKTIGWRSWILGGGGPCRSPHKSGPFRQGFGGLRAGPERGPASLTWPPPSGQHHHRAPYTMAQPSPLSSSEARVLEKGPGSHQKQLQKNIGSQFCFHKSGPFRQGFEGWRTGSERGPASPTWPPLSGQHHHRAPYTMAQPSPLSSFEIKV